MDFDLIIVGGGLVGASLACALQRKAWRIALIDARSFATKTSSNDPRLFALNKGSCQLLKNLGLWPDLKDHATPIHEVHVSMKGRFGGVRLNKKEVGLDTLGHVIPARNIEDAFNQHVAHLTEGQPLTIYRNTKLQALSQQKISSTENKVTLHLLTPDGEMVLTSALVVAADGTDSTVRRALAIETEREDYQQSALVSEITLNRSHEFRAYERFYQNEKTQGAIAMLPLGNEHCAMIWSAHHAEITHLNELSDELFLQTLQKTFGYRLGRLQGVNVRHHFALQKLKAKTNVNESVLLLGNAAHTLHPIAAQGLNLALYEVALLAEEITKKMDEHQTFSAKDFTQLAKKMLKQQGVSEGISHGLTQLLNNQSPLFAMSVSLGMIGLDIASPIKKHLMERMMARAFRVPRLLLGNEYEENYISR